MARREIHEDVPSATNLPSAPKDDRDSRVRNYVISMTIRTICFVLAVLLWAPVRWLSVVLMLAAVFLPYFAVVMANATNQRRIDVLGSVRPTDPIERLEERRHDHD
ncbi:DUF3099 domain-containing protein [Calidifontibacter terrae]